MVTGANSGLGLATTRAFVSKNIKVIMACRNIKKGAEAKSNLLQEYPKAKLEVMKIDLADLNSVRDFAEKFSVQEQKLDILVNNAGVMMPPYEETTDGFELQFGVNYLSHFLLTGLLLPKLEQSEETARIVNLSSLAHKWGIIDFEDLQFKENYDKKKSYGQSKLACLMFAYELELRLKKEGKDIQSIAAHPGLSKTNLARHLTGFSKVLLPFISPFAQAPKNGAHPEIRAALDTSLKGGEYIGPSGWFELSGKPVEVGSNKISKDLETHRKLWAVSGKLTGISYLYLKKHRTLYRTK